MSGHSKDEGLAPCPFCGSDVELRFERRYVGPDTYAIWCGFVSCEINPSTGQHLDEAEAIAAWNRRSSSSAERGMREALEKIDAKLKPQFDLSKSLTRRDRLSLLTTLHADRMHADDMETIEEAVDYIDGMHNFLDRVVTAALSARAGEGDEQATRGEDAATASTDRL